MSEFKGRGQVENALGRTVTQDELRVVETIGELSSTHLAVLQVLSRRQRLAALLYLQAVVPNALSGDLNELINNYGEAVRSRVTPNNEPLLKQLMPSADEKLIVRFDYECIVYLMFHPCVCGDATIQNVRISARNGHVLAIYEGVCAVCGRMRQVEFVIGGDDHAASTVVDAGQWLLAAEQMARQVPADLATLNADERRAGARFLERAVVALEEALKFVAADTDAVPEVALFSHEGRALRAGEPGRFRGSRIAAVLATYREAVSTLLRS